MGGEPVPRQQGKNDRSIPCLSNEIGPCRPYGFQGSYCVGGTSRDTNSKKSRMPSGMKKLRKCSSNCARVDALSMGWQDVLKQRKRPLLGRPPCTSHSLTGGLSPCDPRHREAHEHHRFCLVLELALRRLEVLDIPHAKPSTPLVGTVERTLRIQPYHTTLFHGAALRARYGKGY